MPNTSHAVQEPEHPPKYDLGVLLVHGIGEQKQGETLTNFGGPIIRWLDQWLRPDTHVVRQVANLAQHTATKQFTGSALFTEGTLRPPDLVLDTPAHATATIVMRQAQVEINRQSWLFAESWWSPQTIAPRVTPFLLWLITRGPWVLLLHLAQRFNIDIAALRKELTTGGQISLGLASQLVKFVAATLIWMFVSTWLVLLWAVVSLIALVPLGYVRKRVYDFLLAITGVIGDSYVLVSDPTQRAAFVSSTRKALRWLQQQGCRRVAVIAHSQGAAVARDVLIANQAPQVNLFLTFGPGIAKLDALDSVERNSPQDFLWCGAAGPLGALAILVLLRLWSSGQTGFALWGFPVFVGVITLAAIRVSWSSVDRAWKALQPNALQVLLMRQYQPKMRWRDYYASHDPVSNGSLSTSAATGVRRIVSRQVTVLASMLRDHTSYWSSRADFLPCVARALDQCARCGLFSGAISTQRISVARRRYLRCVRFLRLLSWNDLIALLLPLWQWQRVLEVSKSLRENCASIPVESLRRIIGGIEVAIGWLGNKVLGTSVDEAAATGLVLLTLIVFAVLNVWRRIVSYWWRQMASLSLTPMFVPSEELRARVSQWLLICLVQALGSLPLVLSATWSFAPEQLSWRAFDDVLARVAALIAMIVYIAIVAVSIPIAREAWQIYQSSRSAGSGRLAAAQRILGHAALLTFWIALCGGGGAELLARNSYVVPVLPVLGLLVLLGAFMFAFFEIMVRVETRRPLGWCAFTAAWWILVAATGITAWLLHFGMQSLWPAIASTLALWLAVLGAVYFVLPRGKRS